MPIGAIGQVPNNTVAQGIINSVSITGVTTSTWNSRSGGLSKTIFKGSQTQITDLARIARSYGYEYTISGGHVWTLEVTYPWDIVVDQTDQESNPLFVWELVNLPFEKDLMELGDRPFIQPLSTQTKDQIDRKLKTNDRGLTSWAPQDAASQSKRVNAEVAYNLKRIGVRGKQGIVQSLKRTIIVSNQFDGAAAFFQNTANYNVLTKTELVANYSNNQSNPLNRIPPVIVGAMPESLPLKVADGSVSNVIGYSMSPEGIVTFVGWLQFPPEYQMVAINKVQITQHWTFNQWSAGPYGLYDTISGTSPNPNDVLHL